MSGLKPKKWSQKESAKQFLEFIQNDLNQEKGDYIIYEKLPDLQNWLHKKIDEFVDLNVASEAKIQGDSPRVNGVSPINIELDRNHADTKPEKLGLKT